MCQALPVPSGSQTRGRLSQVWAETEPTGALGAHGRGTTPRACWSGGDSKVPLTSAGKDRARGHYHLEGRGGQAEGKGTRAERAGREAPVGSGRSVCLPDPLCLFTSLKGSQGKPEGGQDQLRTQSHSSPPSPPGGHLTTWNGNSP